MKRLLIIILALGAATAAIADFYQPAIGTGSGPPPTGDAVLMVDGASNVLNVSGSNICMAATVSC